MKMKTWTAVVVLSAALILSALAGMSSGSEVQAQANKSYEYGYIVPVQRLESYELEVGRWAGTDADKKYLASHVFPYAQGENMHIQRLNALRLINKLSEEGWELMDAQAGVVRRAR